MSQSTLIFDPATGLQAPDTSAIREAVAKDWVTAFADPDLPPLDTEPTTPAGQLVDSETAIIEDKNAQILFLANQFNPAVSNGIWQDGIGFIYFLTRQLETPTVVTCQVTGLKGTPIPAGAIIETTDGLRLIANDSITIPASGVANLVFSNTEYGPVAIGEHTATKIVTVIPGWDTVDNPTVGVPGTLRESRSAFERRRYASVAANAHGTVPALYGTIGNIPGVVDLVILENITNDPITDWGVTVNGHSVFISVYGGDDTAIAEAIYRKKDAGCGTDGNTTIIFIDTSIQNYRGGITNTYRIERPTPLDFSVQVTARKTLTTPATIVTDIQNAVLANFNGEAGLDRVRMAAICYASRFFCSLAAVGVQDLVSVKISVDGGTTWVDEVTVNADQIPVLSADNISVVILT